MLESSIELLFGAVRTHAGAVVHRLLRAGVVLTRYAARYLLAGCDDNHAVRTRLLVRRPLVLVEAATVPRGGVGWTLFSFRRGLGKKTEKHTGDERPHTSSVVTRRSSRRYFASSNGRARCIVARLSQITRSPSRQRWR